MKKQPKAVEKQKKIEARLQKQIKQYRSGKYKRRSVVLKKYTKGDLGKELVC